MNGLRLRIGGSSDVRYLHSRVHHPVPAGRVPDPVSTRTIQRLERQEGTPQGVPFSHALNLNQSVSPSEKGASRAD